MRPKRLERWFERWRKRRDVRALARVFDATSRELLDLAQHVSHDPSEAEDLVQSTFLAAIESAERFDAERDLVAWLVGILVCEARMAKRRAARRPDPGRLDARGEADPADTAERLELSQALQLALERLPSPYREVVAPYVRDGASPSEIARALGRAPGTVRVQIHRGLELVRRGLPAGALAGGLLLALPTRGLAAVREVVLGRAATIASLPLATAAGPAALVPIGLGGGLAVKKLAVAAGVAALGALAWNLLATGPRAGATFPSSSGSSPRALAEASPVIAAKESVVAPVAEDARADERSPAAQQPVESAAVRVQLAWASNGAPAEGVGVRLGRIEGAEEGEREIVADAGGLAVFEGVQSGPYAVRIDRVQVMEQVELGAGELEELRIEVPDGLTVQGRVVDGEGQGVAGAEVLLTEPWTFGGMITVGPSASDGAFLIRGATANSAVGARLAGWVPALQPILHPTLAGAGPLVEIDVVLDRRSGSIAGRVLDSEGRPIAGARLNAGVQMWQADQGGRSVFIAMVKRSDGWTCRPPPPSHALTASDGTFVLADVEDGDVEVRVRCSPNEDASGASSERLLPEWRGRAVVRAGETTHLEVRMARGATVEGVVRLSDGLPASGVSVSAIDGLGSIGSWAESNEVGAFRITGLNAGELSLLANDSGSLGHGPAEAKILVADGGTATWDVTLPKAALLAGVAVDEDWKGLPNWVVHIGLPGKSVYDAWKTTDAEGRFQFEAVEGEAYDLQLLPPNSAMGATPFAWIREARPGDEIVLEASAATRPSAIVRGVLLGPDGAPSEGGHVALSRTAFPQVQSSVKSSPVDGSFELGPLLPGLYSMVVASAGVSSGDTTWVELEPNEVLDIGVEQQKAPGDVTVRLRLPDGVSSEEVEVTLHGQGRGRELDRLASGVWISRKVPAGLQTVTAEAPGCAQVRRDIELGEGEALELELELVRGAPCPILVVLPPSASGMTYVTITVRDDAGAIRQVLSATTDGSVPVSKLLLPVGTWRVEAQETSEGCFGKTDVSVTAVDRPLPVRTISLQPER